MSIAQLDVGCQFCILSLSVSAAVCMVQGAAERHQAQTTAERRQCEELCKQLNGQLIQERQSASNQLTQVLL